MLFVAKLDLRELELALALDIGLLGAVDHDVGDVRIGEQFLEWPQAQQLVDQHLFQRELLAAVERQLQLGEHFADDRAEFLGQLVLVECRRRLGIDAFEQARKDLLLDLVDRAFEALDLRTARFAGGGLPVGKALHRVLLRARHRAADLVSGSRQRWELFARARTGFAIGRARGATLHRAGDAKRGAGSGASRAGSTSKCTHADCFLIRTDKS